MMTLPQGSMRVGLTPPWLIADLGHQRRVLSFAPHRPGFCRARHILIRQVRDADLTPDLDAARWLGDQMGRIGHAGGVGMMTSRAISHYRCASSGPVSCLATVGLGNAERVGHRGMIPRRGHGTINIALLIEEGLTEPAMIEALSIIAEARTTAILMAGIELSTGRATGTGTDCIALACDAGATCHAGLHTPLGEAIGAAVYDAVLAGALDWIAEHGAQTPAGAVPSPV
ncbi:adenosylcobinamide amidohydrolase [Paracoccus sp. J56]|uniref:adenosylcobinamide amidohydrolase n=1 Tax=Paracoccus sp. J56 TaxID=935850 RepID=UPI000A0E2631|nr:adenosylcobinamide amidohydrolase [Paracoccus sp. J56]SMG19884.1 adenosylcobinamide hydrolase [Paracoccus sp. J56]